MFVLRRFDTICAIAVVYVLISKRAIIAIRGILREIRLCGFLAYTKTLAVIAIRGFAVSS